MMKDFEKLITLDIPEKFLERHPQTVYPEFRMFDYYSRTAQRQTNINVLLPNGYTEKKKYPVLYILHGYFDDETWMARDCVKIPELLTNLVNAGLAKEMIVVLPYIYCSKELPKLTGMDLKNSLNYDNFINDFLLDVIPFVDSRFSMAEGRENRALTGFSMGGRESLFIGFKHPELFGYLGAVDPAPGILPIPESPAHPGQMTREEMKFGEFVPKIVFVGAAAPAPEDSDSPTNYHAVMLKNGVKHIWQNMAGLRHCEEIVKPHLYNFMQMLFGAED